ncbi:MAG: uracil-DNA glycosylase family protein [Sphaerochaetaceae bacterium]|jgi:single-strand selective monofunctional uracil DNA glycosylase|nr:uracil-DNA glycosylase family protein [Sphaerochaetaceae bacterium]HHU88306.1 single-stranded DNA-binding protein [Spirochaetales bacterium]
MATFSDTLLKRTQLFSRQVEALNFTFEGYVYNPLSYAWPLHAAYLENYIHPNVDLLFLGMNPGPFGMAQNGVPFGDTMMVKEWLKLSGEVGKPPQEHPKRKIEGLACQRSEVSGTRLWSLMAEKFGSPQNFFQNHAIMNYCPLVFVDGGAGGRNIIPEKLPKEERIALEAVCDTYLDDIITLINPQTLVGIGQYAKRKLEQSRGRLKLEKDVISILHPSPSSPLANRGWKEQVIKELEEAGVW